MFSAIKSLFVGDSSNQNQTNQMKENKPLKSDDLIIILILIKRRQ